MTAFVPFDCLSTDLLLGKHIIGTSTYKVLLTNSAPNVATWAQLADVVGDLSTANGYTAGGVATTLTKSLTGAVTKVLASDVVVTASGAVGPFRYEVMYNTLTSGHPLVGYTDHGSAVTMASSDTHTVDYDGSAGVFTVGT